MKKILVLMILMMLSGTVIFAVDRSKSPTDEEIKARLKTAQEKNERVLIRLHKDSSVTDRFSFFEIKTIWVSGYVTAITAEGFKISESHALSPSIDHTISFTSVKSISRQLKIVKGLKNAGEAGTTIGVGAAAVPAIFVLGIIDLLAGTEIIPRC